MRNIYLIAIAFLIIGTACEKTVPLDLNQIESRVVIEGQVTDQPGYQYVKISRTIDFYNNSQSPRITNATVVVEDDMGGVHTFVHNPNNHADSAGFYFPETAFVGQVNHSYTLTVMVDGKSYEATDKLIRITQIDKLEYRVDEDEKSDPQDPGRFYELLLFVKEPKETKDYYLFKSFRNDSLKYAFDTDIYYSDDELIGENIDGIPLPIYYAENEKAAVEVYSLSREAFIFYRDLQKLLANDGGMFGTPPSDPRTNFSNGALGLFQVSAISKGGLVIGE
jgi:hypothetical protein